MKRVLYWIIITICILSVLACGIVAPSVNKNRHIYSGTDEALASLRDLPTVTQIPEVTIYEIQDAGKKVREWKP